MAQLHGSSSLCSTHWERFPYLGQPGPRLRGRGHRAAGHPERSGGARTRSPLRSRGTESTSRSAARAIGRRHRLRRALGARQDDRSRTVRRGDFCSCTTRRSSRELHQLHWDACDKLSTTELVKRFTVTSASSTKKQVAVSNFTGALSREGKLKDAKPQIEEIFRYALGANSGAIWIERRHQLGHLARRRLARGGGLPETATRLRHQAGRATWPHV